MHRALPIAALVLFAACPVFQPDTCNDGKAFGAVTFDDTHPPFETASTMRIRSAELLIVTINPSSMWPSPEPLTC